MRAFPLTVALLLTGATLAVLAPHSSAVGYCTSVGVVTRRCSEHVVCIGGGSYGTAYEHCQYSVPADLCDLVYCYWPPPPATLP